MGSSSILLTNEPHGPIVVAMNPLLIGHASDARSVISISLLPLLVVTVELLMVTAEAAEIPNASDACLPETTETTPSNEFNALGNGEVVRHERTSLEWQRCARGQAWDGDGCTGEASNHSWHQAMQLAERQGDGWRLPSANELLSIVERCHPSPAINPQVFPNTPAALFWTRASDTGGIGRAWAISFLGGSHYRLGKDQEVRIRLVREATQAADPAQTP